ncbi:MAG: hypothetical protein KJ795_11920 [Gammaproteobacteria bacterium]|nr:hypothetical protein [Gammaproteobacteria bacterium]MBU1776459.1 hypothetical protein [Gammaproteobacteria bacterium]MBU1968723.1 hypothetical protein [Gammaproteobacteria bacterium]
MAIRIVVPKAPPMPVFPPDIATEVKLIYDKFPKVGAKISVMWGSVELQKYLNTTIFDDRGGRQGFPQPVISALMRISKYHETLIPEANQGDVWNDVII